MTEKQLIKHLQTYQQMRFYKTLASGIKNKANKSVDVCISRFFRNRGFFIEVRINKIAIAFIKIIFESVAIDISGVQMLRVIIDELWVNENEQRCGNATILFQYLFKELERIQTKSKYKIKYSSMRGRLIYADKMRKNWNKSLPFYTTLPTKNLSEKYQLGNCVFVGAHTEYMNGSDFAANHDNGYFEYKMIEI